MYNAVPTWMADKPEAFSHMDFLVLDCTLQPDVLSVLHAYRSGKTAKRNDHPGLVFPWC